jgi:DNA-binding CsgD family transcriptional regulator
MNKRIISNEEFIELWRVHQSAAKIAKLTGISERNVHHRRREIEAKNNIQLVAASKKTT